MPVFLTPKFLEQNGEAIEQRRSEIFKTRYLPDIKACPRVRDLFKRLRNDGIRISLASSAKGEELERYKRLARIEGLVQSETSSDQADRSKPHPDIFEAAVNRLRGLAPSDLLVVGDTPYDAEAATKAGLSIVGVLCGGFPEADLRAAGCRAIFLDPADLLARYDELSALI